MPKTNLPFDGSFYAPVAARISLFYARHPNGRILTRLVQHGPEVIVFEASVYRDGEEKAPAATGWASERLGDGEINSVACLENTETSAIGRALANLGFTASSKRPSVEEMQKAERERARRRTVDDHNHIAGTLRRRPRIAIREPSPVLAADAPPLADAVDLLAAAEREGLDPGRVSRLRARLLNDNVTVHQIERLERALRAWLAQYDAGL